MGVSQSHFVGAIVSSLTADEIRRSLYFSTRVRLSMLSAVGHATQESMEGAVRNMLQNGVGVAQLPVADGASRGAAQVVECAANLRKRLPCTREERHSFRRHVEGYLYRFGLPQWFLTVTVNINHSRDLANAVRPPVEVGVTYITEDGIRQVVDFAHLIPQRVQADLVASDVAGHALHFNQLIEEIVRTVIDAGVLGRVIAYTIFPETQRRGGLHGHGLLFLEGAPRNPNEFRASRAVDPRLFDERMFEYVNSLVRRELSVNAAMTNEDLCVQCPACGAADSVHPIDPPPPRMAARTREEPPISTCNVCQCTWTCTELLRSLVMGGLRVDPGVQNADLSREADAVLHSHPFPITSHDGVETLVHELLWQGASVFHGESESLNACIVDAVLYLLQGHKPTHVGSCFKGGKVVCRFRYPHDIVAIDHIDDEGRVWFRVSALGAWTNGAPLLFIEIFHGNADMTFLSSGHFQGAQVTLYVTKYVAKDQNAHAGVASRAIATKFIKFMREVELQQGRSNFDRARAGVFSFLSSIAGTEEVESSLLALRLITRDGYYRSHQVVSFPGGAFVSELLGVPSIVRLYPRTAMNGDSDADAASTASKGSSASDASEREGARAYFPTSDVSRWLLRPTRFELVPALLYKMFTVTKVVKRPAKNRDDIDVPFANYADRTLDYRTIVTLVPVDEKGRRGFVLAHSNPFRSVR